MADKKFQNISDSDEQLSDASVSNGSEGSRARTSNVNLSGGLDDSDSEEELHNLHLEDIFNEINNAGLSLEDLHQVTDKEASMDNVMNRDKFQKLIQILDKFL